MTGSLKLSAPSPLEYFSSLVADDASLPLVEAAAAIAQDEHPQLDVQALLAEIDGLADALRRRIPADAVPLQRLRWLNRYFFQELGFAGNVNDYYTAANSHLHEVLRTRRGIPITLALLYAEMAGHVGLQARGVSFPGHFLVKLSMPTSSQAPDRLQPPGATPGVVDGAGRVRRHGEVVIDPFTGHSLSREELEELLQPYKRSQGLTGDFDAPLGLFLQAATPREVLARMLRNLKEIHRAAADWPRLLAVLHRLVILLPTAHEERRDRALALAELGQFDHAADDLAVYLRHRPGAADAAALAERHAAWRGLRRRRLH